MSLILDALNKSRQPAADTSAPSFGTLPPDSPVPPVSSGVWPRKWVLLSVFFLVLASFVLGYAYGPLSDPDTQGLDSGQTSTPGATESAQVASGQVTSGQVVAGQVAAEREDTNRRDGQRLALAGGGESPPSSASYPAGDRQSSAARAMPGGAQEREAAGDIYADESQNQLSYQAANQSSSQPLNPPSNQPKNAFASESRAPVRPAPDAEIARLYATSQQTDVTPLTPNEQKAETPSEESAPQLNAAQQALLEQVQTEQMRGQLTPHSVPLLGTLSPQYRDQVPTLLYEVHYFASDTAYVVISGQRLQAGDSVKGVDIVEILEDSVICGYGGRRFRLAALNSWINM